MIAILYHQSVRLAADNARTAMNRASADVVESLRTSLRPISHSVALSVSFGQLQGLGLLHPDSWFPLFSALQMSRDAYSVYFGFTQGQFLQIVRLPPGLAAFGPQGHKPPADARYVVRVLDDSSGEMADVYFYLADWGKVIRIEHAPVIRYSPRQRPWFQAARDHDGVVNSGIYVFSGTGRPGMTLSQRIETPDGAFVGVFGADISLDALGDTLRAHLVGQGGRLAILDETGHLIAHPDADRAVKRTETGLILVEARSSGDALIAEAVRLHEQGAGDSFRFQTPGDGRSYLASFAQVPAELKRPWTILAIADEDDFIAPFRRVSLTILMVGALFLTLVLVGIVLISQLLTRPIAGLMAETMDIRNLRLDRPVTISSPVQELNDLAGALGAMKSALRSFGAYVPKEVVRTIVSSGTDSIVGGTRQRVTILFTDLQGFTSSTEQLEPEEVLRRLSSYFEVMSGAIHHHGGTIDKYVGDAIMALWNAPISQDNHEIRACRAMLACQIANRALNASQAEGLPPFITRFGLHSDFVVVGNVGSSDRMQYTVLGSAVNLASRVEGLNKVFGSQLLVTEVIEETARGHFIFRPFGLVVAAGTSLPIGLFELLGELDDPDAQARRDGWTPAWTAYEAGRWSVAASAFQAYLDVWPDDIAARMFRDRSLTFQSAPPAPDWDGSLTISHK